MALPDLTGQNIQDTYKRVLQIDDGGFVRDGTGSLAPILQMTASHAVTEVTYETSSSYAETASMASSNFIVQGNISASGNISSSGTIVGSNLSGINTGDEDLSALALKTDISGSFFDSSASFSNRVTLNDAKVSNIHQTSVTGNAGTATLAAGASKAATVQNVTDATFYPTFVDSNNGSPLQETHYTAPFFHLNPRSRLVTIEGKLKVAGSDISFESGSISMSGDLLMTGSISMSAGSSLTTTTGSFNHIITDGETIEFRTAGSTTKIGTIKFDPTSGMTISDGAGENTQLKIGTLGATGLGGSVRLNRDGSGAISASGDIITEGNVTASGNISSSGNLLGGGITINGVSTFNSNVITLGVDDGDRINVNSYFATRIHTTSNITASGDISASGNVLADHALANRVYIGPHSAPGNESARLTFDNTSVVNNMGLYVQGQITASGNISASGTLIANQINLDNSGKIYFNEASTTDQYIQGEDSNILIESDNYLNVNSDLAVNLNTPLVLADGIISGSSLSVTSDITASGAISSSGVLYGTAVEAGVGGFTTEVRTDTIRPKTSANTILNITTDITIDGNVTASGNISSSGYVQSPRYIAPLGSGNGIVIGPSKPVLSIASQGSPLRVGSAHSTYQAEGVSIHTTGSDITRGLFLDGAGNASASGYISAPTIVVGSNPDAAGTINFGGISTVDSLTAPKIEVHHLNVMDFHGADSGYRFVSSSGVEFTSIQPTAKKIEIKDGLVSGSYGTRIQVGGMILGSNLTGTNTGDETLASINALDITEVGTITSGVWNGSVIAEAKLENQSGTNTGDQTIGWHGSATRIKILPTDFVADDIGRPLMTEDDGISSNRLYTFSIAGANMYAYIHIPTGFKATHTRIYGSDTGQTFTTYEGDIDTKAITIKGSATAIGTEKAITNVTSDTTNYLVIQVTSDGTADEIHGGYVTIAKV
tara:strand:- start:4272 stop:7109 length:2838 start_codon:yes stop_codon:yes gene_type:complete